MGRLMSIVVMGVVLAAATMHFSAAQTVHVVGDSLGWTVPQGGASAYSTWASAQQFVVGDTVVFNFVTGVHDVAEVPKAGFDGCDYSSPIGSIIMTGPANITLNSTGSHYYICTIGRHCDSGQKLEISVSATPGSSPPSSPAPPTTPTPSSPSPGGTVDDCAPAPSPSTKSNTPSATPPSTSQGDSSSSAVFASVFVSVVAVAMNFFV